MTTDPSPSVIGSVAFVPKLFSTLPGYTRAQLLKDVSAGIIVGIVALPLAIAFAIASGVTPDRGLITAIVAGFLISALGGSRVQIGGPTGAFVVIVSGIVAKHGIDGLLVATFLAGGLLATRFPDSAAPIFSAAMGVTFVLMGVALWPTTAKKPS